MDLNVLCNRPEQVKAAVENVGVGCICLEADMFKNNAHRDETIAMVHGAGKKCAVALPYIFRDVTYVDVSGYDYALVRSLDELEMYKGCELVSDYGLYAMNKQAARWLMEKGIGKLTAPIELNEHELYDLDCHDKEIIIYGHIPMMVSAQCVRKNTAGCDKTSGILDLTDRTGKKMKVENKCAYCYNLIYNPVPMSLIGILGKVKKLKPASLRINLTTEDYEKSARIIESALEAMDGEGTDPVKDFTRGHFTRGVE